VYSARLRLAKETGMKIMELVEKNVRPRDIMTEAAFHNAETVDMALGYVRLDSDSSDFLLRRCDLDTILRPAVRKFAPQFIRRHLTLRYEPVGKTVLTDEKWLGFVIEQVLSNAVKYTPEGGTVTVSCTDAPALLISDTGIGVEPEDLPRVFEQGFTGYNGRADKKATGLGLYLCRRVCRKLGHTITMDSRVGEGTTVTIGLARTEREHE
jgi:signal transduction histidine kinase